MLTDTGLTVGVNYLPTTRLKITNAGNVGIGTADPGSYRLRIESGSTDKLRLYNSVGTTNTIDFVDQGWQSQIVGGNGALTIKVGGTTTSTTFAANGNVSIGTTDTANYNLQVSAPSAGWGGARIGLATLGSSGNGYPLIGDGIRFTSTGGTHLYDRNDTAAAMDFAGGNITFKTAVSGTAGNTISFSDRMTILNSNGNVGIGTTNPGTKLVVAGANATLNNTIGAPSLADLRSTSAAATNAGPLLTFSGNYHTTLNTSTYGSIQGVLLGAGDGNSAAGALTFLTANSAGTNSEKMRIDSPGNVGIGTTNPQWGLDVRTSNTINVGTLAGGGRLLFGSDDGNSNNQITYNSGEFGIYTTQGLGIRLYTAGSSNPRLTVANSSGFVGIGTINPGARLDVHGDTWLNGITNGGTFNLALNAASGNGMIISNGADASVTNNRRVVIGQSSANGGIAFFYNNLGTIGVSLSGVTNAHSYFNSGGNVGIGTTNPAVFKLQVAGNVGPETNNTYDLGSADNRFRTVYTNTAININGYHDITNDNLLVNGDFETNSTTGWTGLTTVTTGGYSGNYTSQTTGYSQVESADYIPVNPVTDVLQLEGWFKKSVAGASPGIIYFGYIAYDANKVAITSAPCGTYCYFAAAGHTLPADGGWHKLSATTHGEGTSFPNFPVGTKYVRVLVLMNYTASSDAVTQMDHVTLKRVNNGPLFVGNNFDSTNLDNQTQATKLFTTSSNNLIIMPPSSGNVGIGTTAPTEKLQIEGNLRFGGAGYIRTQTGQDALHFPAGYAGQKVEASSGLLVRGASTTDTPLVIDGLPGQTGNLTTWSINGGAVLASVSTAGGAYFAGNVGIGASPSTRLHVTDGEVTLRLAATNASGRSWDIVSGGNGNVSPGIFAIRDITGGATRLEINTSGNLRLNAYGSGTLSTDSSGNVTAGSDERLKDIDGEFTRGLNDLMKINPVNYHWKASTGFDTVNSYTGFSAQNVQSAIPEAVGTDSRGYLTLSDRPILAASVNALKELAGRTDLLSYATSSLASRLTALETAPETGALTATEVTASSVSVSGTIAAHTVFASIIETQFNLGSTTVSATLPATVLTTNGSADLARMSAYAIAISQESFRRTDLILDRLSSIEEQLAILAARPEAQPFPDFAAFTEILNKFSIRNGMLAAVELVVDRLTVGSREKPTGITFYDEVTGEPYCLSIRNGAQIIREGECQVIDRTQPDPVAPAPTPTLAPEPTPAAEEPTPGETPVEPEPTPEPAPETTPEPEPPAPVPAP
ncbi:MAG: tail fiber domain-containing protein [bacterium]|nr:tail fiber domain-containing protein [bacterium]